MQISIAISLTSAALRRGGAVPPWTPAALFANGEIGHWPDGYDPANGRMWQDSAGVTPVTAAGQPVGLLLDMTQGAALGANGVVNGDFAVDLSGWTNLVNTTWDAGRARCVAGAFGQLGIPTGGWTLLQFDQIVSAGTRSRVRLRNAGNTADVGPFGYYNGTGPQRFIFRNNTSGLALFFYTEAANDLSFDNISARPLAGYHAAQATALSRPTLRQTSGKWYLENDGGDSLPIVLPAGTYGRAWVDAAGLVTVDTVTDPTKALIPTAVNSTQADVILRQGAFTTAEEASIRSYWAARYTA